MRFIVVADSHIRFPDDDVVTYPSNALMVDRNRRVVELCNRLDPEFVVHLGDIVHPLPVEDGHEPAVRLASDIYSRLDVPIHYVAGNHDVGDKPNALVAVPAVADENYPVFEQYWGPPFASFDYDDCHCVILDTPALNSGLQREADQQAWLDADLAAARDRGRRIFVFTHYPPFVRDAAEDEHYDNLGEPARSRLLETLVRFEVEAVFSGHVHNFLYNHHEGTNLYVVPATGFVRPDYSELAAVVPEQEGGRDDPAKLGLFVVDVKESGHVITPVRTFGAIDVGAPTPPVIDAVTTPGWTSPIGVTLRHGWMSDVDFPTSGLDEFRRKTIRNDALVPALWEARITDVRIPLGDIAGGAARDRLGHLHGRGMNFTVRSAGVPDDLTIARVTAARSAIARWEIVVPPRDFGPTVAALAEAPSALPVAVAPLVPLGQPERSVHHFVTSGFDPSGDPNLDTLLETDAAGLIGGIVFRVAPGDSIGQVLAAAAGRAQDVDRDAVVNVELPRAGESIPFEDDAAVANRVEEAARAALSFPDVAVFLDGFVDHDRSYYPHHGLIDRRFDPRPALHRLIEVASEWERRSGSVPPRTI
jgi:predicted phosphodiesterase